jgi:2-hydroxy-6-oxonona-2,4-dienedioate hydrolase
MRQKIAHVNSYNIRYLDYDNLGTGAGKVLILLHGIGASAERWLQVAPALSKHYRTIIPDIVGFGYSDKPTVEYTMDFFVEFLQGFLNELRIVKCSILGSSFGGHLATEYAIRFSNKVEKLVLAAPAGIMKTSTPVLDQYIMAALYPTYENAFKAFSDMAYNSDAVTEETIMDFVNRMRLPNAKYAFMSTLLGMRYAQKLQGRLGKIISPTLLVWGDNDRMIPPQYASAYEEIPDKRLVIMKECGHTPYVEKPQAFNRIVLKFLTGEASSD